MKIFINKTGNRIVEVNDIEFIEHTDVMEINDLNDFLNKAKEYFFDEEIEMKISNLFSTSSTEEDDINLQTYNIKHWVSNRSFGEIIDMYISGEILKPNMQREFVWDSLKCSRLIESIILGLPIPPLFLLEIDKNKYEIIDGFQRINTLVKFSESLPWNIDLNKYKNADDSIDIENAKNENSRAAKLSKSVAKEISNKKFGDLNLEHQRILRRSTIPLIEFNQVSPDNFDSKYLIFERINTGSEKLNPMQIRKSLVYGNFIEDLYSKADSIEKFKSLFSNSSLKKDYHIEAYLRTYVMIKIAEKEFITKKSGIKNILNEYCEKNKNKTIEQDFHINFNNALDMAFESFPEKANMFKKIDMYDKNKFIGNLNVSIMEAFLGTIMINMKKSIEMKQGDALINSYKNILHEITYSFISENENLQRRSIENGVQENIALEDNRVEHNNPFSVSTGTLDSIFKRFEIFNRIVSVD